jgi:phosphoserine aminotransferase
MTKGGKIIEGIFQGETINTPSMLCVEDYIDALNWAKQLGGLKGIDGSRRCQCEGVVRFLRQEPWLANLAEVKATRPTRRSA